MDNQEKKPSSREKEENTKPLGGTVQIRLKWGSSEELESIYANQLYINHSGGEFYMVFGELVIPPSWPEGEFLPELTIEPKVRLVVSPEAMNNIAKAIQENVEIFLEKQKSRE